MDVVAHIFPLPRLARHLAPITFDMVRIIFSDNIYIDLNRNRRAAVKINFTYLLLCFLSFEIFDRTKTNNKMFHLTLETYYNLEGDCVLFYFFTIFFFVFENCWPVFGQCEIWLNIEDKKFCWKSFFFVRIKLRVSCRKKQIEQIFSVYFIWIHKWNFQLFRYFQRND